MKKNMVVGIMAAFCFSLLASDIASGERRIPSTGGSLAHQLVVSPRVNNPPTVAAPVSQPNASILNRNNPAQGAVAHH